MDSLQSVEHGEDGNTKDHYSEVIQDLVRKNRVRLYGRGVTKTDLKKKDKNSGFIFPQEFLQRMETQLVQKLAPSVASVILSQIQAANPGVELVIPDFSIGTKPNDASRDQHLTSDTNEQASNGPQLLDCEVLNKRTRFLGLGFFRAKISKTRYSTHECGNTTSFFLLLPILFFFSLLAPRSLR
ncbi:hypothetical protein BVRB_2g046910 isoform A [Beta vulgaris subsp. vulgaris]|nr:hypothetical protein BVRB_2g046910 isoform A [Beta vulgaris subsp. vulgaris]